MSDISGATSFFPQANEGFTATLGSSIAAGASIVPLNSVVGLTTGSVFVGIIEPGAANQQTFTGIVDTADSQITSVWWTRPGTNVAHSSGVTIVDYVTGTALNLIAAGLLKQHTQTGAHHAITNTGSLTNTGGLTTDTAHVTGTGQYDGVQTFSAIPVLPSGSITPAEMTAVKLSGLGGSYTSTPPAINGAFLMMAGSDVVTFGSNSAIITFATPFPNGLLTAVVTQGDVTLGLGDAVNINNTSSKTQLGLNANNNGAARVNWIAIGW